MSTVGKSTSWLDQTSDMFRTPLHLAADVETVVAESTPLLRLVMAQPKLLRLVREYREARDAVVGLGGQLARASYDQLRVRLQTAAKSAGEQAHRSVLRELAAWDQFVRDAEHLGGEVLDVQLAAAARDLKLTAKESMLLRELNNELLNTLDPRMAQVRDAWRHFIRVVGPDNESALALIVKEANRTAEEMRGALAEFGQTPRLTDLRLGGYTNRVQGLAFEAYGRRSLVLLNEISLAQKTAAEVAKKLGDDWAALHVNSELFLAAVPARMIEDLRAGARLGPLTWKQYADDAVVALRKSKTAGGVGDIDARALIEFKAEVDESRLGDKLVSFHERHTRAADGEALLVRFREAGDHYVTGVLRPPDTTHLPMYYAVGTSNTYIPTATELRLLGIDQRKINLRLSRDELRDLTDALVWAALKQP